MQDWLVLGRNEAENAKLEGLRREGDFFLKMEGIPGPLGLLRGKGNLDRIRQAAAILVRYSKAKTEEEAGVVYGPGPEDFPHRLNRPTRPRRGSRPSQILTRLKPGFSIRRGEDPRRRGGFPEVSSGGPLLFAPSRGADRLSFCREFLPEFSGRLCGSWCGRFPEIPLGAIRQGIVRKISGPRPG